MQKERKYNTKKILRNNLGVITYVFSEVDFDVGTTILRLGRDTGHLYPWSIELVISLVINRIPESQSTRLLAESPFGRTSG